jgi:hypothetical protein
MGEDQAETGSFMLTNPSDYFQLYDTAAMPLDDGDIKELYQRTILQAKEKDVQLGRWWIDADTYEHIRERERTERERTERQLTQDDKARRDETTRRYEEKAGSSSEHEPYSRDETGTAETGTDPREDAISSARDRQETDGNEPGQNEQETDDVSRAYSDDRRKVRELAQPFQSRPDVQPFIEDY